MRHAEESEVWIAAQNMIGRFGDDAAHQASIRADEMRKYGDEDVQLLWLRVWEFLDRSACGKIAPWETDS